MAKNQRQITKFNKGLITEAGELTFPEGASVDELNCDLRRSGARRKRLGLKYEDEYVLSDWTLPTTTLVSTNTWTNVGGKANKDFLVLQVGAKVYFYDKSTNPLSSQAIPTSPTDSTPYALDLLSHQAVFGGGAASFPIETAEVDGALVIVSEGLEPFYVIYDWVTETFSTADIEVKIRDFEWQGNKYEYTDPEPSPSSARSYDTKNAGWVGDKGSAALTAYIAAKSAWPPLTHPWFAGKDSSGNFSVTEWEKVFSGTSLIGNGHYILDLFNKQRGYVGWVLNRIVGSISFGADEFGTGDWEAEKRFKCVAAYSGRVFYSGLSDFNTTSKVYFSKTVENYKDFGACYQINDPTSEDAILLDTDGGYINVSGASNITSLIALGSSLVVLAENGVWEISGVDDVFRASEYSVRKITDIGVTNPKSIVDAEGMVMWWSNTAIHAVAPDQNTGRLVEQNISVNTIQSFFDEINPDVRDSCLAEYDYTNKKIFWMYGGSDGESDYKYQKILVYDLLLGAFYPWEISDSAAGSYITATSYKSGVGRVDNTLIVVDSAGNLVVDSLGDQVVSTQEQKFIESNSEILFCVRDGATGKVTFAKFESTDFLDWGENGYPAYMESFYDFQGDMSSKKSLPYITIFSKVTETGWTGDEMSGYTRVRPSSLKVSCYWDGKKTPSSSPQQAYRLKTVPVVDPLNLNVFDYPDDIVTARLKVRGRGRFLKLRFDAEAGHDFHLVGYETVGERSNKL